LLRRCFSSDTNHGSSEIYSMNQLSDFPSKMIAGRSGWPERLLEGDAPVLGQPVRGLTVHDTEVQGLGLGDRGLGCCFWVVYLVVVERGAFRNHRDPNR